MTLEKASVSLGDERRAASGTQARQSATTWVRARGTTWLPLAGVVLLSFGLTTWNLSKVGYGNTYYAAAVRSMTMSWKNFFFGAFDPGGFISVDKPPAFLWVGALSARIFGYSTWPILLPSSLAGAASVGLLWLIVRRYFGTTAATIAALVLALSPISVAVNRLNLPEPFLLLALLGSAGCVLRSLESRRWWAWTAAAGLLVGVAFNTKMLAAWIPLPALALALVVAMPKLSWSALRNLLARLALFAAVTLAVSAAWMITVDSWPASDRPYVGGSTNNTTLDLALGYNGFGRVNGESQGGGGTRPGPSGGQGQPLPGGANGGGPVQGSASGSAATLPNGQGAQAQPQVSPAGRGSQGGLRGAGGIIAGIPSLLRMLDDANGAQIGWLLPFALGGGLVGLWVWRRDPTRRACALLFLGWVLLYAGVFSYARGIYHAYYTSAMAPGVAALVGIGTVAAAKAIQRHRRWLLVVIGLVGVSAWAQLEIAGRTPDYYGWVRPLTVSAALVGTILAVLLSLKGRSVTVPFAGAVAGLLLLPGAWSFGVSANVSLNATLPQAGPQEGAAGRTFGSQAFDEGSAELAAWLESHSPSGEKWQLVVSSSQNGSRLVAECGVSVMALGGFSGNDNTLSVAEFADLVAAGDVRYVLISQGVGIPGRTAPGAGWPDGATRGRFSPDGTTTQPQDSQGALQPRTGGFAGAAASGPQAIMSAVRNACAAVTDSSLPAGYQGQVYDCTGKADAIRQQAG